MGGAGRRFARWFYRFFIVSSILGFGLTALGLWLTGIRIGLDVQRLIGEPACMPSFVYLWKPGMTHEPKVGDYVLARMPKTSLGVGAREVIASSKRWLQFLVTPFASKALSCGSTKSTLTVSGWRRVFQGKKAR